MGEFSIVLQTWDEHPLVFTAGYANMESVFYCLNIIYTGFIQTFTCETDSLGGTAG